MICTKTSHRHASDSEDPFSNSTCQYASFRWIDRIMWVSCSRESIPSMIGIGYAYFLVTSLTVRTSRQRRVFPLTFFCVLTGEFQGHWLGSITPSPPVLSFFLTQHIQLFVLRVRLNNGVVLPVALHLCQWCE